MSLPSWLNKKKTTAEDALPQEGAPASDPPAKINHKNMLNLFFYIFNIVFTYGVGTNGWLGNGTNGELSEKYQSIITPKSTAFSIWAVIFVAQAIFAIVQFLKCFRAHPMVQQGVSYWYCGVSLAQVGWTFSFSYEIIPLSLIFMLLILFALYGLLYSQYYTESTGKLVEFWLLRFPFAFLLSCCWRPRRRTFERGSSRQRLVPSFPFALVFFGQQRRWREHDWI